eukprot:scaffold25909_cov60-Phaeocystis_antarctica.AAC.2
MQRPSGLKQLPNIRTGSGGAQRFGHVGGKKRCAWDGRCGEKPHTVKHGHRKCHVCTRAAKTAREGCQRGKPSVIGASPIDPVRSGPRSRRNNVSSVCCTASPCQFSESAPVAGFRLRPRPRELILTGTRQLRLPSLDGATPRAHPISWAM